MIDLATKLITAKQGLPEECISLSHGWWDRFRLRHPQIAIRKPEKISRARMLATDRGVVNNYFDMLYATLSQNNILDRPSHIFNCDESGMPLQTSPKTIVTVKGQKHPYAIVSGTKNQITVMGCVNAAGYAIPPCVIFQQKRMVDDHLRIGEVPDTFYCVSDSGWMTAAIFEDWFENHFLVNAPSLRPLVLLLDGHSSHYNLNAIRLAAQSQVIMFCLPPNTIHMLQPLDGDCFAALKASWQKACIAYTAQTGCVVTKKEFSAIFCKAWQKSMTLSNIAASFKHTGVYPFDPTAICLPGEDTNTTPKKTLAEETGLAYIPLLSPEPRPFQKQFQTQSPDKQHVHAGNSDKDLASKQKIITLPPIQMSDIQPPRIETLEKATFTDTEETLYRTRYEEGYDIHDDKYNLWLRCNHPHVCITVRKPVHPALQSIRATSHSKPIRNAVTKLVNLPTVKVDSRSSVHQPKATILTAPSTLQMLEEKEHRKVNLAAERMEKKKAREEKTAQKKKSTAAMQRGRQVAGASYLDLLYTSRLLNWS